MDYLFIIYSCKKNETKSNLFYNLIYNRLPIKCYIVYGNEHLSTDYEIIDDKYLVLKCGDFYENLCEKSVVLFKTVKQLFPNIKGVFKCDDDIIPNINKLTELIQHINNNNTINYLGHVMTDELDQNESTEINTSRWHYGKCMNDKHNVPKPTMRCVYVAGPLYYLSMHSIDVLCKCNIDYDYYFFEDNTIGYFLSLNSILSIDYPIYYDNMSNYNKGSIQNHSHRNILFISLHGGLGNQLFQVAAGYKLANLHNMFLVLVVDPNYQHCMTHNENMLEFVDTIFRSFNYIVAHRSELPNTICYCYKANVCFEYDDSIIQNNNQNYLLRGYFQNKEYFDNSIIDFLINEDICNRLLLEYPKLNESFFIHIRRGDYVDIDIYSFDIDSYYKKAVEYILQNHKTPHFFILSDDTDFVEKYEILNTINKTIVYGLNTLDSLYFMSLCKKGGICANSTFSGWGSKLNSNKNKIVVCPKQWIHVDFNYEIPFDYSVAF